MIKKSLYLTIPLTLSIMLSGCGTSSSSDDQATNTETVKTATAIFNATSNNVDILYTCGTETGKIQEDGKFTFEEGKSCTFTYGDSKQTVDASALKEGVEINEKPTPTTTATNTTNELSTLSKLLMGKTYYSVQLKDARVIKLVFENEFEDGKLWVSALLNGASGSTTSTIIDNTLKVPMYGDFVFLSENMEEGYLLFDNGRRMYTDKTKAEAFATANK